MNPIEINTRADYDLCKQEGFEPLIDPRFVMANQLRVSIQQELFGKGHTPEENEKYYRWCWDHKPHYCEECMKPLREYSAVHISHILTRGAHPAIAHDPRNFNMLCFKCHGKWENGDRESMRIYAKNELTIKMLKNEYETL